VSIPPHFLYMNIVTKSPFLSDHETDKLRRSGKLNAKQREVMELQAKVQARAARAKARFAEGMQDVKEVKRDLEWTSKRVS
jgi:biogenesis of lysosome-related organelles complex 1 subunit KXD1